jgi:hypothetical protein
MTPDQMPTQDLLDSAIRAIENGEMALGQTLLRKLLDDDPYNERAWLWMAVAAPTQRQRIEFLEQVLSINPYNPAALETLRELSQSDLIHEQTVFERHNVEETDDLPVTDGLPELSDHASAPEESLTHPGAHRRPSRFKLPHLTMPAISLPGIDWIVLKMKLPQLVLPGKKNKRQSDALDFETHLLEEAFFPVEAGEPSLADQLQPALPHTRPVQPTTVSQTASKRAWEQLGMTFGWVLILGAVVMILVGMNNLTAENDEIRRLQELGVSAPVVIDGMTIIEEAADSRYIVSYEYQVRLASGDLQTYRRQDDVRYDTYTHLTHNLPVYIRFLPLNPSVARLETELVPMPDTSAQFLVGMSVSMLFLGAAILLTGLVIRLGVPRLERQGRLVDGVIVDLWSETNALGRTVYRVSYTYTALRGRKRTPQIFTQGILVTAEHFKSVKLGIPVQVRFLPSNPAISRPAWEESR